MADTDGLFRRELLSERAREFSKLLREVGRDLKGQQRHEAPRGQACRPRNEENKSDERTNFGDVIRIS
jgi:hypothetical protein